MAGRTNDLGTLREIKICRNDHLVPQADVYDYILNGKVAGDVRLTDGNVIYVRPYNYLMNITGKMKCPMFYEMESNEGVGTLLKYARGFMDDAYKEAVRLVREAGHELAIFNVPEFDTNISHIADDGPVSAGSIIRRYNNMIEIGGAVFHPGLYQLGNNINSVRTLVQHAGGPKEEAFTSHGVTHHMKGNRTLEVMAVDVTSTVNGAMADMPSKGNDVLFIPIRREMMQQ